MRSRAVSYANARCLLLVSAFLFAAGCGRDEESPNPCDGVACSGHGTCVSDGGGASCECDEGYLPGEAPLSCVGQLADPCVGVDCSGHGACTSDGPTPSCECVAGYVPGAQALTCVPEGDAPCEGVTCSGFGSCVIQGGTAACNCQAGYEPGPQLSCVERAAPGHGVELQGNLHASPQFMLNLRTMTSGTDLTDYDVLVAAVPSAGPTFFLGPDATGVDQGGSAGFDDLDEAPADGYRADDPAHDDLVIGTSYKSGGSGTTGFVMTKHLYVLKLAHGEETTYAKLEVLQAKAGVIIVRCYHQADGSRNLSTEPAE